MMRTTRITGFLQVFLMAGGCLVLEAQVQEPVCQDHAHDPVCQDHHHDHPEEIPVEGWQEDRYGSLDNLFTPGQTAPASHSGHLSNATGEIEIIASTGFLVYKTFISSQDKPSCIFTPSCSEYAMQSIEKKGLILGWLSAFDRLARCHGLVHHEHYPFDPEKQRFYDPVE